MRATRTGRTPPRPLPPGTCWPARRSSPHVPRRRAGNRSGRPARPRRPAARRAAGSEWTLLAASTAVDQGEGRGAVRPALLDAATGLLEGGADLLASPDRRRRPGRTAVRHTRGRAGGGRRGRPRRAPGRAPARRAASDRAHWQEAYVLGQWSGHRHLDGGRSSWARGTEEAGDGVLALRAGFLEAGGDVVGSVEVSAQERLRRRPRGARFRDPSDRGARHRSPAARDRRGPDAARARPTSSSPDVAWTSGRGRPGPARPGVRRPGLASYRRARPGRRPRTGHRRAGRRRHRPRVRGGRPAGRSAARPDGDRADRAGRWAGRPSRRPPAVPASWPDGHVPSRPPTSPPPIAAPPPRWPQHGLERARRAFAPAGLRAAWPSAMNSSAVPRRLLAGAAVSGLLLTGLGVLGAERRRRRPQPSGAVSPAALDERRRPGRQTRASEVSPRSRRTPACRSCPAGRHAGLRQAPVPGGVLRHGRHRGARRARRGRSRRDAPPAAAGGRAFAA